ncbi:MAG: hypothetical protein MRY63_07340 [Neomegalonema sp.]|nr:hypothetical protein [Neomegalonema sp.]
MSIHDLSLVHGARSVGQLSEADPLAETFIRAMRCWMSAPDGPQRVSAQLAHRLPPAQSDALVALLEDYLAQLAHHHRRKLMRHAPDCPCIGADEALMADVITNAAIGNLDEAYLSGARLVDGEGLFDLVEIAAQLGRALLRSGSARQRRSPNLLIKTPSRCPNGSALVH